jgi:hypothetical protein
MRSNLLLWKWHATCTSHCDAVAYGVPRGRGLVVGKAFTTQMPPVGIDWHALGNWPQAGCVHGLIKANGTGAWPELGSLGVHLDRVHWPTCLGGMGHQIGNATMGRGTGKQC